MIFYHFIWLHFGEIWYGHHATGGHAGTNVSFATSHHASHWQEQPPACHFAQCLMRHFCNQTLYYHHYLHQQIFKSERLVIHTIQNWCTIFNNHLILCKRHYGSWEIFTMHLFLATIVIRTFLSYSSLKWHLDYSTCRCLHACDIQCLLNRVHSTE